MRGYRKRAPPFFRMLKTVKLFTGGEEKSYPMLATGTTAIRYKSAFGRDLLLDIGAMDKAGNLDYETVARLAYIMNSQATGKDLTHATVDDYMAWLDALDGDALLNGAPEIIGAYLGSRATSVSAKNQVARQTDR